MFLEKLGRRSMFLQAAFSLKRQEETFCRCRVFREKIAEDRPAF